MSRIENHTKFFWYCFIKLLYYNSYKYKFFYKFSCNIYITIINEERDKAKIEKSWVKKAKIKRLNDWKGCSLINLTKMDVNKTT
jgi:hypothetical protein